MRNNYHSHTYLLLFSITIVVKNKVKDSAILYVKFIERRPIIVLDKQRQSISLNKIRFEMKSCEVEAHFETFQLSAFRQHPST